MIRLFSFNDFILPDSRINLSSNTLIKALNRILFIILLSQKYVFSDEI